MTWDLLASWKACADGAANRLYDLFLDEKRRSECVNTIGHIPFMDCNACVSGSSRTWSKAILILSEMMWKRTTQARSAIWISIIPGLTCRIQGVNVIYESDQDSTDLQKCLSSLSEHESSLCLEQVFLSSDHLISLHVQSPAHGPFAWWAVWAPWSDCPHHVRLAQTSQDSQLYLCRNWRKRGVGSWLCEFIRLRKPTLLKRGRASTSSKSTSKSWDQLAVSFL